MKRLLSVSLCCMLLCGSASATILPASSVDEAFREWTGLSCTPAVVLCESLSVLDNRGDQGGKKVDALYYSGGTIPVIESWDGYAKIYYADASKTGWVRSEYLMMAPAWYICDEDMTVYAYPDAAAPRVALLDAGTKLPTLTQYGDGQSASGWVCVSLRGAAGWIRKTPQDTAGERRFHPAMLSNITGAILQVGDDSAALTAPEQLAVLAQMMTSADDRGGPIAGCPFDASLTLKLADGQDIQLLIATDDCCTYRVDGRDYAYARNLFTDEGAPDSSVLFSLFEIDPMEG